MMAAKQNMHAPASLVMGIESSCDETAIAIIRGDGTVLAHALASQRDDHGAYGGVVPEIAARAHLAAIDSLYQRAMQEAKIAPEDISAIAATTGPGLIGGVMVGAMFAKALASAWGKPFLPINHLEAHALTVRAVEDVAFPYMLLLVSGGHCQILEVRGVGDYALLGQTRDDALGEAFDKCAKLMGLGYPGGPRIEALAHTGDALRIALPTPMHGTEGCDFSFSGLKTAVRLAIEAHVKTAPLDAQFCADLAASFQRAAIACLRDRLTHAFAMRPLPRLVVAGGVAANAAIRVALEDIARTHHARLHVAPPALCTDNGIMVAWAGVERLRAGAVSALQEEPRARWPLADLSPLSSRG